jgi:hypothetical protein
MRIVIIYRMESPLPTAYEATDAPPAERVIAGTLCLMSCFTQHRLPVYAARIAGNLRILAADAHLTPEMRALCHRLSSRWQRIHDHSSQAAGRGRPPDGRRLH